MKSKRILIIEDDPVFADWIKGCLPGAEKITVPNCEDAKTHLRANKFDVVILDLSLAKKESKDWLRLYAPKSALVCITGASETFPEGFDATEWKINLDRPHLVENLIYEALRKRRNVSPLFRDVEAVESCARLMRPLWSHVITP